MPERCAVLSARSCVKSRRRQLRRSPHLQRHHGVGCGRWAVARHAHASMTARILANTRMCLERLTNRLRSPPGGRGRCLESAWTTRPLRFLSAPSAPT
ncbi:hypothetical protein [Xanthomonas oryzae pv. oryzae MAFF 311018]|nr:hypothetical protein [Xanthomonas oryzae pv. oryzae MAFF 311018]